MNITKEELRDILDETANYKTLRSRIEELAEVDKIDEEQREFVEMVTRLDAALAKIAGKKPRKIDPSVTAYRSVVGANLSYKVGDRFIMVNASANYQSVACLKVYKTRCSGELASFRVKPIGPEAAASAAASFINHINAN